MTRTMLDLQADIMANCERLGWYDDERSRGEDRALLHSEISEALEAYRDHGYDDQTAACHPDAVADGVLPKPEGVGAELADVVIRLLDTLGRWHPVPPPWMQEAFSIGDVIPYRVQSPRFGDWLDVMHRCVSGDNHELLLRTLVGAAEFMADVDLEQEVVRKMSYNATRGHRHGGKRL